MSILRYLNSSEAAVRNESVSLFASDASQDPGEIGLPLEPQKQRLSVPLELVHETDSLYVIRLPNNQIMRIDKDLVSVVIPRTN
jgi:hypothetical protein